MKKKVMRSEIVYIISDYRSGSTLLDQLLGAHPDICSVGEIHHLIAYVRRDRSLYNPSHPLACSCGKTVANCDFWCQVERKLERPLSSLRLQPSSFGRPRSNSSADTHLQKLPKRLLQRMSAHFETWPILPLLRSKYVAKDSFQLFDAIAECTHSRYIVDASKELRRFRLLKTMHPDRMRLVLLCRDYRAVIYSKMKRGRSLEASAQSWANRVKQMELLGHDMVPERLHRLRYEDLCVSPDREINRLCKFLALDYSPSMELRPSSNIHHIGGSPSKFESNRQEISLDTAYQEAFTADQLSAMKMVVGHAAAVWGYD